MKRLLLLLAIVSAAAAARGDLVMREQADFGDPTNLIAITIKIHGDKIRQDLDGPESGDISVIKDAATGEIIVLMRRQKLFTKPPRKTDNVQSPDAALSAPKDNGKGGQVGEYDTEIYAWAADRQLWNDTNGMIQTLWVAKDFPDFDKIRPDLAKLDRANISFPGKGMQPAISNLPGMVVKSRLLVKIGADLRLVQITLLTAREEPVDATNFDVPAGYEEWTPPSPPDQPASAPPK